MMIGRAMIAIAGLLAMTGGLWPASGEDGAPAIRAAEYRLPFQLRNGLIYIQGQVNGKRGDATCRHRRGSYNIYVESGANAEYGFNHHDEPGERECVGLETRSCGSSTAHFIRTELSGTSNSWTQMASSDRTF
jgi:hypothetical protein